MAEVELMDDGYDAREFSTFLLDVSFETSLLNYVSIYQNILSFVNQ